MVKIITISLILVSVFLLDVPCHYTVTIDGVETAVLRADGGCSDYYRDESGIFRKSSRSVSEPSLLILLLAGVAGVVAYRIVKKRNKNHQRKNDGPTD